MKNIWKPMKLYLILEKPRTYQKERGKDKPRETQQKKEKTGILFLNTIVTSTKTRGKRWVMRTRSPKLSAKPDVTLIDN